MPTSNKHGMEGPQSEYRAYTAGVVVMRSIPCGCDWPTSILIYHPQAPSPDISDGGIVWPIRSFWAVARFCVTPMSPYPLKPSSALPITVSELSKRHEMRTKNRLPLKPTRPNEN